MTFRAIALAVVVLCLLLFTAPAQNPNQVPDAVELARGSFIFVFDETVVPGEVRGLAVALTQNFGGSVTYTYQHTIRGFAAKIPAQAAARIAQQPFVKYYEPDGVAYAMQRPVKPPKEESNGKQTVPWGVTRVGGVGNWADKTAAWVIDTGIDLAHKDLNVDLDRSANFVLRGKDSPNDGNGHGTHVAGTIAAIGGNGIDVVGVAAGATLVAVRVLDNSGSGTWSAVIAGVDYVAANAEDGDVANMSLGGPKNEAVDAAVAAAASLEGKGIKFAIAAGNSGADAGNYSPAGVEEENVYTVSAIGQDGCLASWSNYGSVVDYAAPGVSILSTKKGGGTTTMSGTSMAAPHVAGLLLLGCIESGGDSCGNPQKGQYPIAHQCKSAFPG
jgi:subtilisin family serine protease